MKKLLILSILLLFVSGSQAWMSPVITGGGVPVSGGASCDTDSDSRLAEQWDSPCDGDDNSVNIDSTSYYATKIVLSSTTTITEYKIRIADGNGSGDVTFALYNNNTTPDPDEPDFSGGVISGTSATVGHADIGGTAEDQLFTLATPTEVSSGTYWVLATASAAYYPWYFDGSDCGDHMRSVDSGSTWGNRTNRGLRYEVYGCQ